MVDPDWCYSYSRKPAYLPLARLKVTNTLCTLEVMPFAIDSAKFSNRPFCICDSMIFDAC